MRDLAVIQTLLLPKSLFFTSICPRAKIVDYQYQVHALPEKAGFLFCGLMNALLKKPLAFICHRPNKI